jgi:hypothetical protein
MDRAIVREESDARGGFPACPVAPVELFSIEVSALATRVWIAAGLLSLVSCTTEVTEGAVCTPLATCSIGEGGRGNVCSGVTADSRFLVGANFEAYEGARVVSRSGHTVIKNGSFMLYLGYFSGCNVPPIPYRIESSPNGRCDDADQVYLASGNGYFSVSGGNPGTTATCAEFLGGLDLDLTVRPECLPNCGAFISGLFDASGTLLARDVLFLDGPSLDGHAFSGALVPDETYSVRYYYSPDVFGGPCGYTTEQLWQRSFTAADGTNTVELSTRDAPSRGDCF